MNRQQIVPASLLVLFAVIAGVIVATAQLSPYFFLVGSGLVFAGLLLAISGVVTNYLYEVALFCAILLGLLLPKLAFLIPSLPLGGQIGIEDIFVVALAISIILRDRAIPNKAMHLIFFGLLFSSLVSIFWSSVFIDRQLVYQDFFSSYNVIRWWALWLIAFKVERDYPNRALRVIILSLVLVFFIEFVISIAHILRWPLAVNMVLSFFRRGSFYGLRQASGTFPNGNYLGIFTVIVATSFYTIGRYARNAFTRVVFWSLAGLAFILLILSESRFSILAIFLVLPLIYVVNPDSFRRPARSAFSLILVAFLTLVIFLSWQSLSGSQLSFQNSDLVEPLSLLGERGSQDGSVQRRLADWQRALEDWSGSPIFGQGPSEADELLKFHGDWVELLRNYGLFGFSFYLAALIVPLFISLKLTTKSKNRRNRLIGMIALATLSTIALAAIAYEALTNVQMATIMWPIAGMASGRLAYIYATGDKKS